MDHLLIQDGCFVPQGCNSQMSGSQTSFPHSQLYSSYQFNALLGFFLNQPKGSVYVWKIIASSTIHNSPLLPVYASTLDVTHYAEINVSK